MQFNPVDKSFNWLGNTVTGKPLFVTHKYISYQKITIK